MGGQLKQVGGGRNRWQAAKTGEGQLDMSEGQLKQVGGSENRLGAVKTGGWCNSGILNKLWKYSD